MTAVALEDYAGSSFFLKGMAAPAPGTSHLRLLEDRASSCIKGMRVALKKMQLPQFKGDVSLATALPRNRVRAGTARSSTFITIAVTHDGALLGQVPLSDRGSKAIRALKRSQRLGDITCLWEVAVIDAMLEGLKTIHRKQDDDVRHKFRSHKKKGPPTFAATGRPNKTGAPLRAALTSTYM